MPNVLQQIVAETRKRVQAAERRTPIDALRSRISGPARDFHAALARPRARFIFECKARSPSQGALCDDYDAVGLATAYQGAADAISVLTDGPFFGGSVDDLRRVREQVSVPVLAKDFILGPYQVVEARQAGADAVLLMASVLTDKELSACLEEVRRLEMHALVEVHGSSELDRVLRLPAPIVGINNRDLETLEVHPDTAVRLAPRVPLDRLVVAESGYRSREQVDAAVPLVDAFLVGSALSASVDPRGEARALAHGRVKVCGLRRPEDVESARDAGAYFGGVIFAPASKRRVDKAQAALLSGRGLPLVAVVRNQPVDEVLELCAELAPAAVQLHGDEDDAYVAALRERLPPAVEVWSVCGVDDQGGVVDRIETADRTVFDRRTATEHGGAGRAFDWSTIEARPDRTRALLAGGLRPENAAAARAVGTWALDVATGVESEPGVKCRDRLEAFFLALRSVSRKEMSDARVE